MRRKGNERRKGVRGREKVRGEGGRGSIWVHMQ